MAFDGVTTYSVVKELQNIKGFKINKVYEPDKNTIILELYSKGQILNLNISISSINYRINLTANLMNNPLIAPNFCMLLRKHLIGLKIKSIYTNDLERIVFIDMENNENPNKPIQKKLIIELMGKHSNIILTDTNEIIIDSMRHTSTFENSLRDIYPTARYIFLESKKHNLLNTKNFDEFFEILSPYISEYTSENIENIDDLNIKNFNLDKIISKEYNGISSSLIKNIINNLKISSISKDNIQKIYDYLKNLILSENISLINTENIKDYFLQISDKKDKYCLNYQLDEFYYKKETYELFKNKQNTLLNIANTTLQKYKKRLTNINNKISECKNMETFRLYGELITTNLYKITKSNVDSIQLENYYDNYKIITIPLNIKYSPSYNAKMFFKKYSKLKNALDIVTNQREETKNEILYIESVVFEIENAKALDELTIIYEEMSENNTFSINNKALNKKNKQNTKTTNNNVHSFNPLKYCIDGYNIFVGRNNKENDYLTCKLARKNDIWFHAKDIHGSHVILKTETEKQIPDKIIFEAAKLAAQHSQAKNSSHIPVDYCKISYVKKPNKSKPGFVIYTKNKTIII